MQKRALGIISVLVIVILAFTILNLLPISNQRSSITGQVTGKSVNDNLNGLIQECTDTDYYLGKNSIFLKGTTESMIRNTNRFSFKRGAVIEDRCISEKSVIEHFCNPIGKISSTVVACPKGSSCTEGACSLVSDISLAPQNNLNDLALANYNSLTQTSSCIEGELKLTACSSAGNNCRGVLVCNSNAWERLI